MVTLNVDGRAGGVNNPPRVNNSGDNVHTMYT